MEIKDLDETQKITTRLYNKFQEKIDNTTGEVTTIVSSFLQKEKTKDDFLKLFAENITFLIEGLSSASIKVFLMIIKNINYQNVFQYTSEFVNYFVEKEIMSKSSVYNAINELIEKKVILKITKEQREIFGIIGSKSFIINPQIAGKGSFRDLKKLRQTVVKTFDFDKFEMKQEVEVESEYEGLEEVKKNPEDFYVENVKQVSSNNLIENEIVISKKQDMIENVSLPSQQDKKQKNDFCVMVQSFEITSKMLDIIKDLEASGKKEEAISFQKNLERYLETITNIVEKKNLNGISTSLD